MNRRKFITRSSRWFLAGGLLGTTGLLLHRRKIGDPDDCYINPYCKQCSHNKSCSIVAAEIPDTNEIQSKK